MGTARAVRLLVPVAVVALLLAALVGVDRTGAAPPAPSAVRTSPAPCQERGYAAATAGDDVVALVRDPAGAVRTVSFEHGWRVHLGRRPGTLLALCRDASRG